MSYPRTPTTTTSAATTTPNATPNESYAASPGTPTVSATPSASTPSRPHNAPSAPLLTAIFDAEGVLTGFVLHADPLVGSEFPDGPFPAEATQAGTLLAAECYVGLVVDRNVVYVGHADLDAAGELH